MARESPMRADASFFYEGYANAPGELSLNFLMMDLAQVDGPIFSAAARRRAGIQKAWRRCALGMCSEIVVCAAAPPSAITSTVVCAILDPR